MDERKFSRRQFLKRGLTATGGGVVLGAVNANAATPNSIVTENQLTGTPQSQWDLSGQGQYSGFGLTDPATGKQPVVNNYIEGFADNMSVNHGQTINFKINTDSTNYRIDIYRLGYYQGLGARLITTIQMRSASLQPTPLTNAAIGLVDAGNWKVTASWAVPASAVSGVYLAHLVRQGSVSGENHIVFIVRDDGTKHDIVFQTSDTTWQAYNGWGGPNLYGGAPGNMDDRANKVSYNRPFSTRDSIGAASGPQDFVFGAEYSAIRWLEANGYDVCYISGVDTARNGGLLLNGKVFTSTGHDEYWSGNQRANVEAARAAGVHLIFMSGNEIFWKTRWEPSIDPSATPNRTLVCYKETRDNRVIDPADPPTWTGSWRDPRFSPPGDGGRPENALTGQIWTVDSYRADTITIPYPMTKLRFWRNTSVSGTGPGQTASLVKNLLGYEWDESPDNGFRPAGLIHLSSTFIRASKVDGDGGIQTYMIDYGLTDGAYAATHNLSLFRDANSGAIVFGAGTVFWSWGLDADHDLNDTFPTPVDLKVQQAMVNLFADMGVQPQTLQSGLVAATMSTDTTPPVSTISPIGNVNEQQAVTITGTATDIGGGVVAGVEVSTDGGATWHPATGTTSWSYRWWPQAPGTFKVLSRAIDDSLNVETPGAGISVAVTPGATLSLFDANATSPYGGKNAPAIVGPVIDHGAVELGVQFQTSAAGTVTGIRFYKNPWNTGTHVGNLWSATGTLLGSATFTNETAFGWQQVNLSSPVSITAGTTYVVSFHCAAGNYSADDGYFATPRNSGALKAPPNGGNSVYAYGASSIFPSNSGGTTNYWVDVVFARAGGAGNQPPTANNDSGFVATMNTPLAIPASALLANDTDPNGYTLSITGVSNPVNGTVSSSADGQTVTFVPTTGYPSPNYTGSASFNYTISNGNGGTATGLVTLSVTVPTSSLFSASSTPGTITVNDSGGVELGVKFQATSAGKAIGVRFYKGPKNTGTHVGNLWNSAGALLASVTFTAETASGWQQANFSNPVTLTTGATYVVSYHCNGFYSADGNYFANAVTNGPLTAPSNAASGGNGVFAYGSSSVFPTNSYNAANYWVDVAFATAGALGNVAPTANNDSGFVAVQGVPLPIPASALLANDSDPNGFALSITGVSNASNGSVSYDAGSQTVTFTPTAGYAGAAGFTYTISNGNGGTASANVSLTVVPGTVLFSSGNVPAVASVNDSASVEVGVQFQTSVSGSVSAIRFYKGPQNSGTHVGNLWSASGTLLASATFTNETAGGWQHVNLSSPVPLTPGVIYVVSYHTNGFYSASGGYFSTAVSSGPLTAPAGGNGVYAYGSSSIFPTGSFNSTNYWVDLVFN
jgi:Domain of unknown function (DUF4082)/Cadherin-like domain